MNANWQRVFNPSTTLHWGPWSTDLPALVHGGWDIKVEDDPSLWERMLYFRSPDHFVTGVSEPIREDAHHRSLQMGQPSLRVALRFATRIEREMSMPAVTSYQDVRLGVMSHDFQELHIFDGPNQPEEIIVEPETVSALLARIKDMQSDTARDLLRRQNYREGETRPEQLVDTQLSAKILTFAR